MQGERTAIAVVDSVWLRLLDEACCDIVGIERAFFHCAELWSRAYLRLFATMSSSMAELLDTFVKNDQTLFSAARRTHQVL